MGALARWLVVKRSDATPDQPRGEGTINSIGYVRAKSNTRVGRASICWKGPRAMTSLCSCCLQLLVYQYASFRLLNPWSVIVIKIERSE